MKRHSTASASQRRIVPLSILTGLFVVILLGCQKNDATVPVPADPSATQEAKLPPWFEDVTDQVGLKFIQNGGPTGEYFMPQSMVGGCAMFDANGDSLLDLLLLQSAGPKTGVKNQLYLQNRDHRFIDASEGSGLNIDGYNVGIAIGDIDDDGLPDVLITQYVGSRLFHNEGSGKFRDITEEAGIVNPLWGSSAAFLDYDRDGRLDLAIVNYLDYDRSWPCTAPDGSRDFCGPSTFPGTASRLFRNLGKDEQGRIRFQDVTIASGLATKVGPGLGIYCADFTGDDWPDMLITNDGKPNHLWVNQRNQTFKDEAVSRGIAYSSNGSAYANMGIAIADYDGNGLLDSFVTHLATETHTLWQQSQVGLFSDRTAQSMLLRTRWKGTGFGAVGADFDLDGWPDIAFVNGRVYTGPVPPNAGHLPTFWQSYSERNQLMRNIGEGKFQDISEANDALCGRPNVARGLAMGDYDQDGRLDLLVLSLADRARLYRNIAPAGHWLGVKAIDPNRGGRSLYGTTVRLKCGGRTLIQVVQPSQSYLSSSDPELIFGCGEQTTYEAIDVTWPNGEKARFPGGELNRRIVLKFGEGKTP